MTDSTEIRLAYSEAEIAVCYPVMAQLRPHLSAEAFLAQVQRQQARGFKLAYLSDDGVVRAAAGFRIEEMLARGMSMYVDDLVTSADGRSAGYGRQLLDWLKEYARQKQCVRFDLDSGVQRGRAHHFYFREGLTISAYHFSMDL